VLKRCPSASHLERSKEISCGFILVCLLLLFIIGASPASPQSRSVEGIYRNFALGYSIRVPQGLTGETGDQAGPERGVTISLRSGGKLKAFGEPNSFEWKTPEEGVKYWLNHVDCKSSNPTVNATRLGNISAAQVTV